LYVVDGQAIKLVPCSQKLRLALYNPCSHGKVTKDVASDLAGEVFFADLVPEENRPSRQYYDNGTSAVFGFYLGSLHHTRQNHVWSTVIAWKRVVLAETRLNTLHGGVVRAPQASNGGREKLKFAVWF